MPESATGNFHNVASLHSGERLKNVGGCMSVFSHMLHLNRLGRGANKLLATPDVRPSTRGETISKPTAAQEYCPLSVGHVLDTERGIDLRKILDAKQEPFVLQDVIWEKRHPVRSRSSREIKLESEDVGSLPHKSQKSRRVVSQVRIQHTEQNGYEGVFGASSGSYNDPSSRGHIKGSPAESIVALPSSDVTRYMRKMCYSSLKPPSTSKSAAKASNKKALLMEAAARILEGSNRRTSKISLISFRFFLTELDVSRFAHNPSKSKELNSSCIAKIMAQKRGWLSQNKRNMEQSLSGNNCSCSSARSQSRRLVRKSAQTPTAKKDAGFEMTDEEALMIMQNRLCCSGEMPNPARELSTGISNNQRDTRWQSDYIRASCKDICSDETAVEAIPATVGIAIEDTKRSITTDVDAHGNKDVEFARGFELETRSDLQSDEVGMAEKIEDLVKVTDCDLSGTSSDNKFYYKQILSHLKDHPLSKQCGAENSGDTSIVLRANVLGSDTDFVSVERSGCSKIGVGVLDAPRALNTLSMDMHTITMDNMLFSAEAEPMDLWTRKISCAVPLLCNYSWWNHESIQASLHDPNMKQIADDCAGCDSPFTGGESSHDVGIYEEQKRSNFEVYSASPDHSYAEECQQSSPVSVLDSIYEGAAIQRKPFEIFDEARRKVLESVRRYEMLAGMDLDMLIKINEDSVSHIIEDESVVPNSEVLRESDIAKRNVPKPEPCLIGSPAYDTVRHENECGFEGL
ncbi:hypothetical protein KP509_28G011700 [Ceratopteris richardii]|uniref:Uncharacterized protein n=1 Tax=Ceratopteris richardii TaxID=49495 RepID=A0A8T2R9K1_CERRI|nr:hypothetical protein KP509_28G011700 [Ceratopteris richardii]